MANLRIAKTDEFDRTFSLLEESFPIDEYRPREAQKALLHEPRYTAYILPDSESENLKALITVWQLEDFAFIEHFAVNPKYRNQGIGSAVLQEIAGLLPCQICLEVELPETEFAKRRIDFYQRNGFFLNDYPYMQPPYSKGKKPVPLRLMTSGSTIPPARFAAIKQALWETVYNNCSNLYHSFHQ